MYNRSDCQLSLIFSLLPALAQPSAAYAGLPDSCGYQGNGADATSAAIDDRRSVALVCRSYRIQRLFRVEWNEAAKFRCRQGRNCAVPGSGTIAAGV